jgi:fructose-1,6-bisphosphatase
MRQIYSFNESNRLDWDAPLVAYIDALQVMMILIC